MSTLAAAPAPTTSGSPIFKVARVQLTNRNTFIYVPLMVWAAAFFLTLAIWAVIRAAGVPAEGFYSGSAQAPLWYMLVVGAQSVALTFPFAQALSFTRRDFYLGTLLVYVGFSVVFGAFMWLLSALEGVTDGWWIGGHFATFAFIADAGDPVYFVFYGLCALVALNVGFCFGTIWKRGGATALTLSIIGVAVAMLAAGYLITVNQAWAAVGRFFSPPGGAWSAAAALAGVVVLTGAVSWALIRRTPA